MFKCVVLCGHVCACRCVFGGIYFGVIFTKQLELPFVPMWLGTVAFTATEIKTIPTD